MHDVADLPSASAASIFTSGWSRKFVGDIFEEVRDGYAQSLGPFVLVGRRPCSTGELNFLLPHLGFAEIERQFTARTPEIDLKGQRVQPRSAVEHPLQRRVAGRDCLPGRYRGGGGHRQVLRYCGAVLEDRPAGVAGGCGLRVRDGGPGGGPPWRNRAGRRSIQLRPARSD